MLDFGFSEILLTSAIALVVLGPERLPKVARQVGNWMGRARAMARQLTEQLEREVNAENLLKAQNKLMAPLPNPQAPQQVEAQVYTPPADLPAANPGHSGHEEYEPGSRPELPVAAAPQAIDSDKPHHE